MCIRESNKYNLVTVVDGTETSRTEYYYEAPVTAPADASKDGYTFAGWTPAVPATMPIPASGNDYVLTASFTVNKYTVKFYRDADATDAFSSYEADYDSAVVPASTTKTGYTFAGWTPDVGFMDENGGKTYYATWVANDYNVVYYVDGEVYDTLDIAFGEKLEVPSEPGRTGRTFIGWTDTEGSDTIVDPTTFVMNESGYKFYAVFSDNTYNAIFYLTQADKDNGVVFKTVPTVYGQQIAVPEATARAGYTFLAWSPAPGAMPANDLEFVGTWKANTYTIKFTNTGDSTVKDITGVYGASITAPADPVRTGYTFAGWDPEPAAVTEDTVFTAVFEKTLHKYTITWVNYDGTVLVEDKVTRGDMPEYTGSTPTKPYDNDCSYEFSGWAPELTAAMEDTTYTAQFTAVAFVKHTVSFDANGGEGTMEPQVFRVGVSETLRPNAFAWEYHEFLNLSLIHI